MTLNKFNSSKELSSVWDDFAARYTNNGIVEARISEANFLNELVTTDITPQAFVAKYGAIGFGAFKEGH